jgi:hypothetical protein
MRIGVAGVIGVGTIPSLCLFAALASEPPPVAPLPPPRPALDRAAASPRVTKTEPAPAAPLKQVSPDPAPVVPQASPFVEPDDESFPTVRPLRRRPAPETPAASAMPGQLPSGAHRAALAKLETPLALYVMERTLEQVLGDVARAAGLRVRVNDRLEEIRIVQRRLSGTAREVLEELTRSANLVWFVERDLLEIAKADTSAVKTFQVGRTTDVMLRDSMQRFGLVNADFAVEVDEGNGIVRVFAPPRLMSRIESILAGLRPPSAPNQAVEVIRFGLPEKSAGRP